MDSTSHPFGASEVERVGNELRRPVTAHTPAVHLLLTHLRSHGFSGVPRILGFDEQGRERLSWIEGEAPAPPYPIWSITDRALASMAALLRRYHEAVRDFQPGDELTWSSRMADPEPGPRPIICHNDPRPEHMIFPINSAEALVGFDHAAPGRPVWDLAALARLCIPLTDPGDAAGTGRGTLDPGRRLRVVVETYGLHPSEHIALLDAVAVQFEQQAAAHHDNDPAASELRDRRRDWLDSHRGRLLGALTGGS